MYVTSKKSAERMIHEENCRYAKMMAPRNKVFFHSAQDAYAKGKIACRYCSMVMKKLSSEMTDIQNICEANGLSIAFNYIDGTLEVTSPMSEWKIAPVGNKEMMNLYHKNTANFDDGTSPYTGYHFQREWHRSVLEHLRDIVEHDWYKKHLEEQKRAMTRKALMSRQRRIVAFQQGRHIEKMRSSRVHHTSRENVRYAAGMC